MTWRGVWLNAGFGEQLMEDVGRIQALGWAGVRQDVPLGSESKLVAEFDASRTTLHLNALIGGGDMEETPEGYAYRALRVAQAMKPLQLPSRTIEVGNEPNRAADYAKNPRRFVDAVNGAAVAAWSVDPGIRIVSGGITTTSEQALDYLAEAVGKIVPGVVIGFHSYRRDGFGALEPQKGFSSRAAEFHRLAAIAAGRQLWNTEVGFHTAPTRVPRPAPFCWLSRPHQWTDGQVARHLRDEVAMNRAAGVEVVTVYQLNDGPRADREADRFGIRRLAPTGGPGEWKPSAYVAQGQL